MTTSARLLLCATAALTSFGCQHDKDETVPADPALLGRWNQVSSYAAGGQSLPVRFGVEFTSGGTARYFRNDSLTREVGYRHRAIPKEMESGPGDRYMQMETGSYMYRISTDTLWMHSPYYKGVINCFPIHEKYVRAKNTRAFTATTPQ